MKIKVTALSAGDLAACVGQMKQQLWAPTLSRWSLDVAADGLSLTLDTDAEGMPTGLPAGVVVVPQSIQLWQARAALTAAGLFAQADAIVRAGGNPAVIAMWDYGNSLDRNSPTLAALAGALGMSPAQVDALFIQAASLTL